MVYAVNTETTLFRERRNIGIDRVLDTLAVFVLLESGNKFLSLDLPCEAVGQIALKVIADLGVILAVTDRHNQEQSLAFS